MQVFWDMRARKQENEKNTFYERINLSIVSFFNELKALVALTKELIKTFDS